MMITGNIVDGVLYVQLPQGFYDVDGTEIRVEGYSGEKVALKPDAKVRTIAVQKVPKCAVKGDGEEWDYGTYAVSIDLAKITHDNNPDDLDTEFYYRKMLKEWTIIYTNVKVYGEPISFVINHNVQSVDLEKYPYCSASVRDLTGKDEPFVLTFNRGKMIDDLLKGFIDKYEATVYSSGTGSSFDKMGIRGKIEYMWGDRSRYEKMIMPVLVLPKDYQQAAEQVKQFMDSEIHGWKVKYNLAAQPDAVMIGNILSGLNTIASGVSCLDVKVRHTSEHRAMMTFIRNLRDTVASYIKEN